MKVLRKIAAVLCAALISGTVITAMPTGSAMQHSLTVSAANMAQAPKLNKTQLSLGKGESYKLTADQNVKWRTSAPKILTVDQNGNVRAVGMGTAWITAKNRSGKEQSCKIIVKNAPSKVSISKFTLTLGVGEEYSLSASVPEGSAAAKRTFRTSNSNIIKMTKTDWMGSFKAVKPGTAWVTVRTFNGKEASCKITVKNAPTWVSISKNTMTMTVGQTAALSASVASDAGCAKRTFRTSDSSIIKMTKTDWTGNFKAVKTGTAWVTVRTYNGKEKSCKIVVMEKDYWRKLYKDKMNSLNTKNSSLSYELYDIDKDGVPELFTYSRSYNKQSVCRMYYVYCGQLKDSGIISNDKLMEVGGARYIYTYDGKPYENTSETVYQKNGEAIDQIIRFDTIYNSNSVPCSYKVNGKQVSSSEFNRLYDKYHKSIKTNSVGRANYLYYKDFENAVDNYPYVFIINFDKPKESAKIISYYSNGTIRWTYNTKEQDRTELQRVHEIGVNGDHYYFIEGGNLVCLNKYTGKKLWEVSGVGASNKHCFDSSGNLYITGYYGPVASKINPDGKLIWCTKSLADKGYMHPFGIKMGGSNRLNIEITRTSDMKDVTILLDAKTGKLL